MMMKKKFAMLGFLVGVSFLMLIDAGNTVSEECPLIETYRGEHYSVLDDDGTRYTVLDLGTPGSEFVRMESDGLPVVFGTYASDFNETTVIYDDGDDCGDGSRNGRVSIFAVDDEESQGVTAFDESMDPCSVTMEIYIYCPNTYS